MSDIKCKHCSYLNGIYRITCESCGEVLVEKVSLDIFGIDIGVDELKWVGKCNNGDDIYLSFVIINEETNYYHINIYLRHKDDKDNIFLFKTYTYKKGIDNLKETSIALEVLITRIMKNK